MIYYQRVQGDGIDSGGVPATSSGIFHRYLYYHWHNFCKKNKNYANDKLRLAAMGLITGYTQSLISIIE
jgi:hypothetical protein